MKNVTLTLGEANIGYGEGLNALSRNRNIDDSDILWVVNPDTRLQADCLELLEAELDVGEYELISPLIYSGDAANAWIWYCGGAVSVPSLRAQHHLYGRETSDAPKNSFETEFITGAAPMMTAATFKAVGGFPRGYFLYWEDVYFCHKARDLGLKLGVVPAALLWHAVGASSGSGQSATYYFWSTRNRIVFAGDIGISRRQLLVGRGGIESLRHIAKALLTERDGRFLKTRAAIRGTVEGLMRHHRLEDHESRPFISASSKALDSDTP
jgi:GT2 family glycosyltransferase